MRQPWHRGRQFNLPSVTLFVLFERAGSFVMRRGPSLARIGLFYFRHNANSVRGNAQKAPRGTFFFVCLLVFFCLFVCPWCRQKAALRGGGGGRATRWRDNVTLCCTDAPFITSVTTANSKRPSAAAWNSPIYRGSRPITPAWPQLMPD